MWIKLNRRRVSRPTLAKWCVLKSSPNASTFGAETMDEGRGEIRRRLGELKLVVALIREARDAWPGRSPDPAPVLKGQGPTVHHRK
jgi:hypothetical protein